VSSVHLSSSAALVERVAVGDHPALRQLYDSLCDPVHQQIRGVLTDPGDISPVLHATFVEVWWLARFHTAAGEDHATWILGIAARRAAERRAVPRPTPELQHTDEISRLDFEGLGLGRSA
jgi:DNA-directed RNA polymerase specialized sigma24 family protein